MNLMIQFLCIARLDFFYLFSERFWTDSACWVECHSSLGMYATFSHFLLNIKIRSSLTCLREKRYDFYLLIHLLVLLILIQASDAIKNDASLNKKYSLLKHIINYFTCWQHLFCLFLHKPCFRE